MTASDLELLRRYEPIIHYTNGEMFFPMAVDEYLVGSEMWAVDLAGRRTLIAPVGLADDRQPRDLATGDATSRVLPAVRPGAARSVALASWRNRAGRPRFSAPSRLSRVGIVARMIDAGFDLSLLVRGRSRAARWRPPRSSTRRSASAIRASATTPASSARPTGRSATTCSSTRSTTGGRPSRGRTTTRRTGSSASSSSRSTRTGSTPVWFARAAHDEVGADLRRRWDDPLLQREGDHPMIFAGAGSHAAYVERGEYLQVVPLQLPPRVRAITTASVVVVERGRAGTGAVPASRCRSRGRRSSTTRGATASASGRARRTSGRQS